MIQTVVVVEDDAPLREQLAWCLLARGYKVVVATNGFEALETMASTRVDLVLLDIGMPWVDGHHVLKRMKDDVTLASIPVVAVTGRPRDVPRVVPTLAKPFSDEQLLAVVSTAIGLPKRRPPQHPFLRP